MSLPQRVIQAGPVDIPELSSAVGGMGGQYADPPYLSTIKQIPFMQLTRLLDQYAELSTYANELYLDLANTTLKISERIKTLATRIEKIKADVPFIESELSNFNVLESLNQEVYDWKLAASIPSNLFTKSTRNPVFDAAYNKCRPPPPLHILDEFRTDGKSCTQFYSDPNFFVEEWKIWLQKTQDDRKAKKKAANKEHQEMSSNDLARLAHEPNAPTTNLINIQINQNVRQHMESPNRGGTGETRSGPSTGLENIFGDANVTTIKAPPPPPPPPPAPLVFSSDSAPATAPPVGEAPVASNPGAEVKPSAPKNFLGEIRNKQTALRKTELPPANEKKKKGAMSPTEEGSGVAAILMRRVALHQSDSDLEEGDEEDDDGWD